MGSPQSNSALVFQGLADLSRDFDLRIHHAERLSKAQLRALSLEYRAVLAGFFDSASEMNRAYEAWSVSASPFTTEWGMALRATQRSLSEDWPGSETYRFQVNRVFALH